MHVVFRESQGLEETETPTDLGQSPADLVVLSFSDSDLSAFAAGWHRARDQGNDLPSLRLANLSALKHPVSVDTYVEQTLSQAKAVLVRLIGGASYWDYGLAQLRALAQSNGTVLAILPGDGRDDLQLEAMSTVPAATLRRLNSLAIEGGAVAGQAALAQLALAAGFYPGPVAGAKSVPEFGCWSPDAGAISHASCGACAGGRCALAQPDQQPLALVVFYRAYLAAADMGPIEALFTALESKGFKVQGLFAPSLKMAGAAEWLETRIAEMGPSIVVNATAFSGKRETGRSALDAGGVPVLQVALATSSHEAWAKSERGLSPTDLAMHVVLPEVDGRIFAGVASFKESGAHDPELEIRLARHTPEPKRIEAIAERAAGLVGLANHSACARKLALVLSTYPGKDWQMAHAVGLDALASSEAILEDLKGAGYRIAIGPALECALSDQTIEWSVADYRNALDSLPECLRAELSKVWGAPETDALVRDGAFRFPATKRGNVLIALQPERGARMTRVDDYHDMARTPCHGYVAFYLWLRQAQKVDALVHVGAHGTLEWLPGKSVALSGACWPEALIGATPVIYPFIVNDPGEAAQAKRRIGAVTLGHVPPPLADSQTPDRFATLEALLDEFSNADGLDPRRRDRLQSDIRAEARALGVESDLGLDAAASVAEAITRIDRFVCDVKESQFGDGLHIWGRMPTVDDANLSERRVTTEDFKRSTEAEKSALLAALSGKRVNAGPSGSPYRGRRDVLPTGRNLYATDPRAVPTRAAYAQGVKLAEELVRRHLQDSGDYPRGLIVDLWGSATMRTAGEEFAMALHLLGVRPVWDKRSERVTGTEIIPIAELERPRLDVTLRVSGLFRDVFPTLTALFAQAVRALAARDEAPDWNPFASDPGQRVYGPKPGSYGLGMEHLPEELTDEARQKAGEAWLAASAWAMDGERSQEDADGISARVNAAEAFVHLQDMRETDLLLAADYAAHEAGFAAAKAVTGGANAALYHLDNTDPDQPRARALSEEVARVVQGRAAQPGWIAGMTRHGFRGAAEIAATLDHMAAFANLAGVVGPHLFDVYYDATLGDDDVVGFLAKANPAALAAMKAQFAALHRAGLWTTRRNSIRAELEAAE
ncbi:MAG: cobaltochelatase subunit CobN [Silicimonas sp.]|nr:cobaltochelatase subunit CobN [Silicimonas sp.]